MDRKSVYVAATSQHIGKTTSTLGIVSAMRGLGKNVGYCKPVGQKFLDINNLRVDKDTILFADLLDFEVVPEVHSPIILGKGATESILDGEIEYDMNDVLLHAKKVLEETHDMVIYEGTGHPGVGSIAGLSNARVAKLMDAGVIMVVEGGIGSTIDMLNMTTSLFREEGVEILGVIVNKVRLDKLEKVEKYIRKWLDQQGLPLLGVVPYDPSLAYPLILSVSKAIGGKITHNIESLDNRVANIIAGSVIDYEKVRNKEDLLLVVSNRGLTDAISKINIISDTVDKEKSPLAGIVVTGVGDLDEQVIEYVQKHKTPLIRTDLDTYGSVLKISRIEVKINRNTPWKVRRAIQLIEENIDLSLIR
jgi:dethiobiotin synthetase